MIGSEGEEPPKQGLLAERLTETSESIARVLKPEGAALLLDHAERLRRDGTAARALRAGDPAPVFTLSDSRDRVVSSEKLARRGPLVVSFILGTWFPYCATELGALRDRYERLLTTGANLVVVAPQSPKDLELYESRNHVPFPLLLDRDLEVARAFGIVYDVPEDAVRIYRGIFGVNLSAMSADRTWRLPIPSRFIIEHGTIVDARVEPDFRTRTEPDETIELLEERRAAR